MSKFKTLVLCLSISDIIVVLEFLSFVIIRYTDNGKDTVEYSCAALKHVMAGTFIFSLYQCFMICLERLNATFATNKRTLHVLTSRRGVCTGSVLIQVVTAVHLVDDITRGHKPCTTPSISEPSFVLVFDLPVLLLCVVIVGVYVVIIFRIIRQQSINQNLGLGNTRSADAMKKSTITLGIIIAVSLVGIMPRVLLAVVSMFTGETFTDFWRTLNFIKKKEQSVMLNRLLGQGTYDSFDMRCMVTGQFGVGKSTLVKLLIGDAIPDERLATDGISLLEGRCGLDIDTREWVLIDPGKNAF
ncbi:unnamed protein product [Mytilus edulis]|uniref:G-protein coupled receptors family 1 profile domain-containing protein n=1 Tax=Mytilus edulis TaxID=6550 RepID=A0A8S3S5H1_MYTED|nr:unnamed protein product [Mytilus edulis]